MAFALGRWRWRRVVLFSWSAGGETWLAAKSSILATRPYASIRSGEIISTAARCIRRRWIISLELGIVINWLAESSRAGVERSLISWPARSITPHKALWSTATKRTRGAISAGGTIITAAPFGKSTIAGSSQTSVDGGCCGDRTPVLRSSLRMYGQDATEAQRWLP